MNNKMRMILVAICVVLLGLIILLSAGCRTKKEKEGGQITSSKIEKGGAQLWAENCTRCHNFRSPGEFSDAQWDTIVHHMRVRANLTAKEHEKIVEFLKAGN